MADHDISRRDLLVQGTVAGTLSVLPVAADAQVPSAAPPSGAPVAAASAVAAPQATAECL